MPTPSPDEGTLQVARTPEVGLGIIRGSNPRARAPSQGVELCLRPFGDMQATPPCDEEIHAVSIR